MDLFDFFREYRQNREIKALKSRAGDADFSLRQSKSTLEFQLGRQSLITQAVWELLSEKLGVTEAELIKKMSEIDLRDGIQDGRITPNRATTQVVCEKCRRPQSARNRRCVFCNGALPAQGPFPTSH